jgi:hypothetical protein
MAHNTYQVLVIAGCNRPAAVLYLVQDGGGSGDDG